MIEFPQKYLDKLQTRSSKKLNDRFIGTISKKILDAGYDIEFNGRGGNALTFPGREAMERNGRKWTIGYKSIITLANDEKFNFWFDAITSESVDVEPTYFYIDEQNSSSIFNNNFPRNYDSRSVYNGYGQVGINVFLKHVMDILNKKMLKF